MRTILFTLLSLIFCVAHSQFIPQPMGYNPDSNSMGIGSEDLMGMLSLFGSSFNSGDSLVVDYFEYSFIEHENGDLEADTFILIYPQGSCLDGSSHWNHCPTG